MPKKVYRKWNLTIPCTKQKTKEEKKNINPTS